jgi:hypothetical protein
VKQLLAACFFVLIYASGNSQGIYTYEPVNVSIKLPVDTSIKAQVEQESAILKLNDFEKDFVYYVNFVRKHPDLFRKGAVSPYLAAYPKLNAIYGEGLLQDLAGFTPVQPLKIDGRLLAISRLHAADLGKHDMMSHLSSNGSTTQQRFEKAGVLCGTECINMGDFPNALEVVLSLLIDYKVANAGHRKSLLNSKMHSIGVGMARNASGQLQYTVADLGCD